MDVFTPLEILNADFYKEYYFILYNFLLDFIDVFLYDPINKFS